MQPSSRDPEQSRTYGRSAAVLGGQYRRFFGASIAAAILLSGGLSFRGAGRYGISINLSRPAASRYYFSLIKKYLGIAG